MSKLRQEKLEKLSAVRIQCMVRKYLALKKLQKLRQEKIVQEAAVRIQSAVRGYMARQRYGKQRKAAVVLQTRWRGLLAGRESRMRFTSMRAAALTIQKEWRMRQCRKEFQLSRQRVVLCQGACRRFLAFKTAQRLRQAKLEEDCAVRMQAAVRGYLANRAYIRQKQATVAIQTRWRAQCRAREERRRFISWKSAAVTVQRTWRTYQCRQRFLEERHRSARIIQTRYRAYLLKREARTQFIQTRCSVIKIQSWVRMLACRREFEEMRRAVEQEKIRAAVVIQLRWRATLAMRRTRADYLKQRASAVYLQKVWRGHVCKWEYQRQREAIITIQRYTRGCLARRYVAKKRSALETIQKTLRRYRRMKKEKQMFKLKRDSIINIQTICRAYLARQQFQRLKEDAEYRDQLREEARIQEEQRRNNAAVLVTRVLRRVVVLRRIEKKVVSATVIQKYWRGYKSRLILRKKWTELTKRLSIIRERLDVATATADPKDQLGCRTDSAIDYLFSIRDVAELICAVKTLDLATRVSEDCCRRLCGGDIRPLSQLLNLINRCNRSVPHVEVSQVM